MADISPQALKERLDSLSWSAGDRVLFLKLAYRYYGPDIEDRNVVFGLEDEVSDFEQIILDGLLPAHDAHLDKIFLNEFIRDVQPLVASQNRTHDDLVLIEPSLDRIQTLYGKYMPEIGDDLTPSDLIDNTGRLGYAIDLQQSKNQETVRFGLARFKTPTNFVEDVDNSQSLNVKGDGAEIFSIQAPDDIQGVSLTGEGDVEETVLAQVPEHIQDASLTGEDGGVQIIPAQAPHDIESVSLDMLPQKPLPPVQKEIVAPSLSNTSRPTLSDGAAQTPLPSEGEDLDVSLPSSLDVAPQAPLPPVQREIVAPSLSNTSQPSLSDIAAQTLSSPAQREIVPPSQPDVVSQAPLPPVQREIVVPVPSDLAAQALSPPEQRGTEDIFDPSEDKGAGPKEPVPLNAQINELLKLKSLSDVQVEKLQELLQQDKYNPGDVDGDWGDNTAGATMEYLKDNPSELANVSEFRLRQLMKFDQDEQLRVLAEQNRDIIDQRIQEKLKELGAENDAGALSRSTDDKGIRDLQTLLRVGGYDPRSIDGIVGGKTLRAYERFIERNTVKDDPGGGPASSEVPKPKEEFDDAASAPTSQSRGKRDIPQTGGSVSPSGFTRKYEGENGHGVKNLAIERAWARISGNEVDQNLLQEHKAISSGSSASNLRPLIVIDLGHGSDINSNDKIDPGAVSPHNGLTEIDVVDPLSARLAEVLHEKGYDVAFTRNPGEQLRIEGTHGQTLRVRPDFAHALAEEVQSNGVIFISMHANSHVRQSANGARIYVDIDGVKVANRNSDVLGSELTKFYNINSGKDTTVKHEGDLTVIDRFENRVGDDISAAVLIELGFLSNRKDASVLAEIRERPEKAAGEIAKGIDEYVLSKVPNANDQKIEQNETIARLSDLGPLPP